MKKLTGGRLQIRSLSQDALARISGSAGNIKYGDAMHCGIYYSAAYVAGGGRCSAVSYATGAPVVCNAYLNYATSGISLA